MKIKLRIFAIIVSIIATIFIFISLNIETNKSYGSIGKYLIIKIDFKKIVREIDELKAQKEYVEEQSKIVYDGLTLDELSKKLDKSLNSTVSGKGYLFASHSLDTGVDPYMAVAIMLQETGCKWECSYIVKNCNNVGGQVGSGCGRYSYFNSIDEGIIAFIDNLANNYINYGLTTLEQINSKYASDPNWAINVNKYIDTIKAQ